MTIVQPRPALWVLLSLCLVGGSAPLLLLATRLTAAAPEARSTFQDEGEPCQPGDPSPPGLTCQVVPGEYEYTPAAVLNARRGDVVLSAACGTIGGLLRQVGETYSHSGIMTRDRTEIRHSTASQDRYEAEENLTSCAAPAGWRGCDGVIPDILRYGWPGTITEPVESAFEGASYRAPEGTSYWLSSFGSAATRCDADHELAWPLVVTAPPEAAASTIARRERVADEAAALGGHYRFFAYSDGNIVERAEFRAPASVTWASGRSLLPTVCTAFIRAAAKRAGVTLEGPMLEPGDERAQVGDAEHDGLYVYSEAERSAAGAWLYSKVHEDVLRKAGSSGATWADAPSDAANQLVNCFAFDHCGGDAKDSNAWTRPGRGVAVSPDGILQWDAPPAGAYGYHEPLVYEPGHYSRVYRWSRAPTGVGTVTGTVTWRGRPLGPADVSIPTLGLATRTDPYGRFSMAGVSTGPVVVQATSRVRDYSCGNDITGFEMEARGQTEVAVTSAGVATANITLYTCDAPGLSPSTFAPSRRIHVSGTLEMEDYESLAANERARHPVDLTFVLAPLGHRMREERIVHCVGEEVRVEIALRFTLDPRDGSVDVAAAFRLYEGESCESKDLEDVRSASLLIGRDAAGRMDQEIWNVDESQRHDRARLTVTITNDPAR